jgi:hypothetical protein
MHKERQITYMLVRRGQTCSRHTVRTGAPAGGSVPRRMAVRNVDT